MSERMFKKSERDFWLYPKLLLVGLVCLALSYLLSFWLTSSWAVGLGFLPLFAIFAFTGHSLSYRQWLMRILLTLCVAGVLAGIAIIVKKLLGT